LRENNRGWPCKTSMPGSNPGGASNFRVPNLLIVVRQQHKGMPFGCSVIPRGWRFRGRCSTSGSFIFPRREDEANKNGEPSPGDIPHSWAANAFQKKPASSRTAVARETFHICATSGVVTGICTTLHQTRSCVHAASNLGWREASVVRRRSAARCLGRCAE